MRTRELNHRQYIVKLTFVSLQLCHPGVVQYLLWGQALLWVFVKYPIEELQR